MTASLPEAVRECFSRFITTEYTTIDSRQQPITWPVTPYYTPGGPTIDLTTGLGYPKKADDAKRNPRVALLFSDPTGSGVTSGTRCWCRGSRTSTRTTSTPTASATCASRDQAAGDEEDAPAQVHARAAELVLRPDLHRRAPRARLRLAHGDPTSPSCTTPTSRRFAPATPRSRRSHTSRRAAARSPGTRGSRARQPPSDGRPLLGRARRLSDRGPRPGRARQRRAPDPDRREPGGLPLPMAAPA